MKIIIGILPRLLWRTAARAIAISQAGVRVEENDRTVDLSLSEIASVKVLPGSFWSTVQIISSEVDGPFTIGGVKHRTAQAFAKVFLARRSHNAVRNANQSFEALSRRDSYFNFQTYREWRALYLGIADGLNISLSGLDIPADMLHDLQRFLSFFNEGSAVLKRRNTAYATQLLAKNKDWFDSLERYPLTDRQREAIVHDEDNCLVVAGAGTGKTSTVMGKVGFILKLKQATPKDILLLAFTQKAKSEMEERIKAKFGTELEARTFHSLGLEIVATAEGKKPSLARWATEPAALDELLQRFINELLSSPQYSPLLIQYLAHHLAVYKPPEQFKSLHEYAQYVKSQDLRTLKSERVNSYEEVMIANWLFLNGIRYEYEAKYPHDTATVKYRQYQPDFYLPDNDVYIEHFGVDRDGHTAPWVNEAEYRESMKWKRQIHQQHKTKLVETFSYEKKDGILLKSLEGKLIQHGVAVKPLTPEEIKAAMSQGGYVTRLGKLVGTFLGHVKSNQYRMEDLRTKAKQSPDLERSLAFLRVFEAIFQRYEAELHKTGNIDFHDMIARATAYVQAGKFVSPFKCVIVDEFQDISVGRYRLLKALLDQVPHRRLFCVGDDWQAIYRFAGTDISIMTSFQDRFGYTRTTPLDRTFRFNNRLCDFSTKFILKNKHQIPKQLQTHEQVQEPAVQVVTMPAGDTGDALHVILSDIRRRTDGKPTSVLLLGRFRHTRPEHLGSVGHRFPEMSMEYMTAHAAKGLEADYAIVLDITSGKYGFPCEIEDDPLLDLVLAQESGFPNAEERRLFYVAVTRAKKGVYLVTEEGQRSSFIDEIAGPAYTSLVTFDSRSATQVRCPKCNGGTLVRREGDFKTFWGCSNYPLCEGLYEVCWKCRQGALVRRGGEFRCSKDECGHIRPACPACGIGMLVPREGKFGWFHGCTKYRNEGPSCTYTRKMRGRR